MATSTQKVKREPEMPGGQPRGQHRRSKGKRIGAFAVAATIALAGVTLIVATWPGEATTSPADDSPAVNPVDGSAEKVATDFVQAYGAFNPTKAITYLAAEADISQLMAAVGAERVDGTLNELRLLTSFLKAQGYEQRLDSCEQTASSSSAGSAVRCTFDFHLMGSDELGRGPFSGSFFELIVRDGEIVRASKDWEIDKFSPQMWEPFADWVSSTYPEDAAIMYTDGTYSYAQLTEKSMQLWERRIREFVRVEGGKLVGIAESFMAARNSYDTDKAMSLLAADGATARLMHNNRLHPNMPAVRLTRAELALAFEAERLYGVRYRSVDCDPSDGSAHLGSGQITCTYEMHNKLRRINGNPPIKSGFGLGFRGDRIDYLSFPWLNIGFDPGGYHPSEGARFVRWLEAEHPEAGAALHRGDLFFTGGQELIHILTPKSIELLAGYLEEYERSVNR